MASSSRILARSLANSSNDPWDSCANQASSTCGCMFWSDGDLSGNLDPASLMALAQTLAILNSASWRCADSWHKISWARWALDNFASMPSTGGLSGPTDPDAIDAIGAIGTSDDLWLERAAKGQRGTVHGRGTTEAENSGRAFSGERKTKPSRAAESRKWPSHKPLSTYLERASTIHPKVKMFKAVAIWKKFIAWFMEAVFFGRSLAAPIKNMGSVTREPKELPDGDSLVVHRHVHSLCLSVCVGYLKKGAELFWEFPFFFRDFFFFFGWGWFWGCPGSFLGKPRGERQVRAGFRTFGGGFRAVQAPFWGNQWWNAGSIQVWTQKTASKSKLSRLFLFFVCIYLCWCVCVCVFVIEYVVCVFFLLLFWFFIQCTSFLVFAIYLFNV